MKFTSDEVKFLRQKHKSKDSKEFYQEIFNINKLLSNNHKILREKFKDEEKIKRYADKIFKDNFKKLG